jgi:UDP-glucose 4-epimerase
LARYLVTGGCGFIGSHLCEALIASGHEVCVLDDLSTGLRDNLAPGAELTIGDVADAGAVAALAEDVDAIFHLAAVASVEQGVKHLLRTHRVNLTGTLVVFDAASKLGIPVIYASSAAVYGNPDPSVLPIDESAPTRPLSAYGADKLGCELHARAAGVTHGLKTLGLRFFNVFGPRQDPRSPYSGVISIFCERIVRGDGVVIYGDGEQTRDFVPVGDVVTALLNGLGLASAESPVLNVCTGTITTVRTLAHLVGEICGTRPDVRYGAPRSGEIRYSYGRPERSRPILGLGEPLPLRAGLERVIDWLRCGSPGLSPRVQQKFPEMVSS